MILRYSKLGVKWRNKPHKNVLRLKQQKHALIENEWDRREDGMIAAWEWMVAVWVVLQLVKWALIPNVCSRLAHLGGIPRSTYWGGVLSTLWHRLQIKIGQRVEMWRHTSLESWIYVDDVHAVILNPSIHASTSCSLFIVSRALVVKPKLFEDNAMHCLGNYSTQKQRWTRPKVHCVWSSNISMN